MRPFSILFISIWLTISIQAQDYYYTSLQYGLHSTLMGGAVTAGNNDLSMGYYNPAAVHLSDSKGGISLIRPQLNTFGFKNLYDKDRIGRNFDLGLTPSLATYRLDYKDRFQLLIITLQKSQWNNQMQIEGTIDEGAITRNGTFQYRHAGDDYWFGVASSLRINDILHVGLSQFISTADFEYDYKILRSIIDKNTGLLQSYYSDEVESKYGNSVSMVSKIGVQLQLPPHSIGLVLKTPNYLKMWKGGAYEREQVRITSNNAVVKNFLDFDLQPEIKTPWEVNLGYAYTFRNNSLLGANVSYHSKISEYAMESIETSSDQSVEWRNHADPIINFSIGYSGQLNQSIGLIGSVRTNFIAYDNLPSESNLERLYLLNGDMYHIAFGANFKFLDHTITLGLDYGFTSSQTSSVLQNFPGSEDLEFGDAQLVNQTLTLVFTYGFIIEEFKQRTSN